MIKTTFKLMRITLNISLSGFILSHFFTLQYVKGYSMSPTLNPSTKLNDVVLIEKITPILISYGLYEHLNLVGKVVQIMHPNLNISMIKRVIEHHKKRVGNEDLDYGVTVEGDEGKHSIDSRQFGIVPTGLVKGIVIAVIFPFDRIFASLKKQIR
jgi:signal peptidase I